MAKKKPYYQWNLDYSNYIIQLRIVSLLMKSQVKN